MFVEDVRGKLSTPQIHNASHVHRVNPITRLNGVKHGPAPRMTFTHGRPPTSPSSPAYGYILSRPYSSPPPSPPLLSSPLFLSANPPIWLVTPIPVQFLPIEPVIPCRSSNLLPREIALLGEIYAYPLFEARHTKKVWFIFIREAILWIDLKKKRKIMQEVAVKL